MQWTRLSLFSQIALLAYLQVIEWVNLFPRNDIRRGNGQAGLDIAIGIVMIAAILATIYRLRIVMAIATTLYAIWLWLQIDGWWISYIRGASPAWKRTYARFFSQTVQVLPLDADHLPPRRLSFGVAGADSRGSGRYGVRDHFPLAIPLLNPADTGCWNW